ncbi:hypothetical protein Xbud_03688 [Xenorhabdus budapestensis]|uniref:Uncharacterized protein n=1 Tax=Xenorhabdus budapestensis TaxID=290110 RepID=A0A2D0IMI1_XENBU|nr:hypothetical protein Xbud_03688 [Xenorhabdus budapestensis]
MSFQLIIKVEHRVTLILLISLGGVLSPPGRVHFFGSTLN